MNQAKQTDNNERIILPPNPGNLALNSVIFILSLIMVLTKMELSSYRHDTKVLLGASVLLFFVTTRSYVINQHYLFVKLFGISIRKIPLTYVQQVIYLPQWSNGTRVSNEEIFFITLLGCEKFLVEYDQVGSFSRRHPIRSMFAYVPKDKKEIYMKLLRNRLGEDIVS